MIHLVWPRLCPACGVVHRSAGPDEAAWRRSFTDWYKTPALNAAMLDSVGQGAAGIGLKYSSMLSVYNGTTSMTNAYEPGNTIGTSTAISESGNDVTVTMANSLTVGQQVTISGATPAGYNGTFAVTSATSTAFHYNNPTSGLGAASVQGTVVLTAGSYARSALTWSATNTGTGIKALAPTLPSWALPAGWPARYWGQHDASTAGNYLGCIPLGAGTMRAASAETTADITTSNTIQSKAHGYTAGSYVVFWGTLPGGLVVGTFYKVITAGLTADAFSVTTEFGTVGDTALDLTGTAPFDFEVQSCVPEYFTGAGNYALNSGQIDLNYIA